MATAHVADLLSSLQLHEAHALQKRLSADADKRALLLASQRGEHYTHILQAHENICQCSSALGQLLNTTRDLTLITATGTTSALVQSPVSSPTLAGNEQDAQVADETSARLPRYAVPLAIQYLVQSPEHMWRALEMSQFAQAATMYVSARILYRCLVERHATALRQFPFARRQHDLVCEMADRIASRVARALREQPIAEELVEDMLRAWVLLRPQHSIQSFAETVMRTVLYMLREDARTADFARVSALVDATDKAIHALSATLHGRVESLHTTVQALRLNCAQNVESLLSRYRQLGSSDSTASGKRYMAVIARLCTEFVPDRQATEDGQAFEAKIARFHHDTVAALKKIAVETIARADGAQWFGQLQELSQLVSRTQYVTHLPEMDEEPTPAFIADVALQSARQVISRLAYKLESAFTLAACPPIDDKNAVRAWTRAQDIWSRQGVDDAEQSLSMLRPSDIAMTWRAQFSVDMAAFFTEADSLLQSAGIPELDSARGAIEAAFVDMVAVVLKTIEQSLPQKARVNLEPLRHQDQRRYALAMYALNLRMLGALDEVQKLAAYGKRAHASELDVYQSLYACYLGVSALAIEDMCAQVRSDLQTHSSLLFIDSSHTFEKHRVDIAQPSSEASDPATQHFALVPCRLSPILLQILYSASSKCSFLFSFQLEKKWVTHAQRQVADAMLATLQEIWAKEHADQRTPGTGSEHVASQWLFDTTVLEALTGNTITTSTLKQQIISEELDPIEVTLQARYLKEHALQQQSRLSGLVGAFAASDVSVAASEAGSSSGKARVTPQVSLNRLQLPTLPITHAVATATRTKQPADAARRRQNQAQQKQASVPSASSRENLKAFVEHGQKATQELQERAKEFFRSKGNTFGLGNMFFSNGDDK
ncbi:hypothetical protein RI367_000754 [Sorochytrium milnesiophthora]